MTAVVNDAALDIIFRKARSYNGWQDKPVSAALLQAVYELMAAGPTSMNTCPARVLYLVSPAAKARLKPHLVESNVDKSMTAPAVAIIANDLAFYDNLPKLFPDRPQAKAMFAGAPPQANETFAMRNGSLQGGYFIIAARALGLDCAPMSGFSNEGVDKEFFAGTKLKSNFICGIGRGDPSTLPPAHPRLSFDEACKVL
ncbi:MAG TPA: malonic semialdehyde reductase [Alphaproteobacteria bacterium]|nr:malonic semialdehyde reductase [Alphaproteobacteria bacterium]